MRTSAFRIALFIFLSQFLLFSSSCTCSSSPAVTVPVPSWPPATDSETNSYPPVDAWEITITSGTSTRSFIIPSSSTTITFYPQEPFPSAVLFQPLTFEKAFFKPSGLIHPYQTSPDWNSGFAAYILQTYYLQNNLLNSDLTLKTSASRFNWEKFIEALKEKQEKSDTAYNPWNLDYQDILNHIIEKKFSLSLLNQKKCHAFSGIEITQKLESKNVLSNYVPQNLKQVFSLKEESTNCFLVTEEKPLIITVSSVTSEDFSLAINSFPH